MELPTQLSISTAENMYNTLNSSVVKGNFAKLGLRSQLDDLTMAIATIRDVLVDAASEQQADMSLEARAWVEKLKGFLYDADDLLDELCTVTSVDTRREHEVRLFFTRSKTYLTHVYQIRRHLKKKLKMDLGDLISLRKRLDIPDADDLKRRETTSLVDPDLIVGRDDDKDVIIGALLGDLEYDSRYIVTIVGMGGLGKTSLAQLVYNDVRLVKRFHLRTWVAVADQGSKNFDVKSILCTILESITSDKCDGQNMNNLTEKLRERISGKKCFLVLDDLWTESHSDWLHLFELLIIANPGITILVTTRSKETAKIIQSDFIHELSGLSLQDSWNLLTKVAFGNTGKDNLHLWGLSDICTSIVHTCEGVPLAIKAIGGLLYGQDRSKWLSWQQKGSAEIFRHECTTMQTLKLSYDYLPSSFKSCFVYCAVFPRDFILRKDMLIGLWIALGFIIPSAGESIHDTADRCFFTLLEKSFFKDVQKDEYGEIISCRMHNLMHILAQMLGGMEICVVNAVTSNLSKEIRHLFLHKERGTESCFTKRRICTFLQAGLSQWDLSLDDSSLDDLSLDALLGNWRLLRVLDLSDLGIKSLPSAIGKLHHLRYLDLSENHVLEKLPKSITKLHNLQTLNLRWCVRLKKLPKDLNKLVNMRVLDVANCEGLTYMPSGIDKLTCLLSLTMFVVAETNVKSMKSVGHLEDLRALNNLEGCLIIKIPKNLSYVKASEGGYLNKKQHLSALWLMWEDEQDGGSTERDEALLNELQPHPNISRIRLYAYRGQKMSRIFVRNLVEIHLQNCHGVRCLPSLSELYSLRFFRLNNMMNLESIEETTPTYRPAPADEFLSFPSLELLQLWSLPKFEGWWKLKDEDGQLGDIQWPRFPHLSQLDIDDCLLLTSLPNCYNVEQLYLRQLNVSSNEMGRGHEDFATSSSSLLKVVEVDDVGYLKLVPRGVLSSLTVMKILFDRKLESLSEIEDVFQSCSSSLHSLRIFGCSSLKSLEGIDHLQNLESLAIEGAHYLDFVDDRIKWDFLEQSLLSLEIDNCSNLVELPSWVKHFRNLQSLHIYNCTNWESIPEWIGSLSSLQYLRIGWCQKITSLPDAFRQLTSLKELEILSCSMSLEKRCEPSGEDWPKIVHIPHVLFRKR